MYCVFVDVPIGTILGYTDIFFSRFLQFGATYDTLRGKYGLPNAHFHDKVWAWLFTAGTEVRI